MTRIGALVAVFACAAPAAAQWIGFSDQTATRLQMLSVPLTDNQEKDLAVADFDKNGWPDVVAVRKVPFSNPGPRQDLLLMNENGVLVDRTGALAPGFLTSHTDARDVIAADFDGDTWIDLVIAGTFEDPPRYYRNLGSVAGVWQGLVNESARFGPITGSPGVIRVCAVAAGDVDGDLDLDLFFNTYSGDTDFLMMNNGSGHFTDETASRLGSYANVAFGAAAELMDFDQDDDLDILKVSTLFSEPPFDQGIFILWNDGTGDFNTGPFTKVQPTTSPYMVSSGRLNGDATLDLYIVQDGQDQVKLTTVNGPGNITWTNATLSSSRTSQFGGNNRPVDIDGDGDLDVGVCPIDVDINNCGSSQMFALLRNDGNGNLSDPFTGNQNFHLLAHDVAYLDIDRDGCLDMLMGTCTGWKVFMRQNCPPPPCYPDCNGDGALNLADFGCFQTKFALSDPYADCNGDGALNLADFGCFQTRFALGCP